MFAISNETRQGIGSLEDCLEKGRTYCLLGSSGVGKSTLINNLAGKEVMRTKSISTATSKGRHVTSRRELLVLDNGAIFIDNPGMREVGIADARKGLESTFARIVELSGSCRFKDCTHTTETGCAVLVAVEKGEVDILSHENYLKMEREKAHYGSSVAEKRNKDRAFGKMIKNFKRYNRR